MAFLYSCISTLERTL